MNQTGRRDEETTEVRVGMGHPEFISGTEVHSVRVLLWVITSVVPKKGNMNQRFSHSFATGSGLGYKEQCGDPCHNGGSDHRLRVCVLTEKRTPPPDGGGGPVHLPPLPHHP